MATNGSNHSTYAAQKSIRKKAAPNRVQGIIQTKDTHAECARSLAGRLCSAHRNPVLTSTFGVVAIVFDCCVRSVELLCIVTVCYIKWTMACMSPAPINTCDIWCETCISWFHFCVRCADFFFPFRFVCEPQFLLGILKTHRMVHTHKHNCAHPLSTQRFAFNRAHCQCQSIVFTVKQKDDCLCVCRLFYVIDENWQYFNGIQL